MGKAPPSVAIAVPVAFEKPVAVGKEPPSVPHVGDIMGNVAAVEVSEKCKKVLKKEKESLLAGFQVTVMEVAKPESPAGVAVELENSSIELSPSMFRLSSVLPDCGFGKAKAEEAKKAERKIEANIATVSKIKESNIFFWCITKVEGREGGKGDGDMCRSERDG